jgi:hypothetical protein
MKVTQLCRCAGSGMTIGLPAIGKVKMVGCIGANTAAASTQSLRARLSTATYYAPKWPMENSPTPALTVVRLTRYSFE